MRCRVSGCGGVVYSGGFGNQLVEVVRFGFWCAVVCKSLFPRGCGVRRWFPVYLLLSRSPFAFSGPEDFRNVVVVFLYYSDVVFLRKSPVAIIAWLCVRLEGGLEGNDNTGLKLYNNPYNFVHLLISFII